MNAADWTLLSAPRCKTKNKKLRLTSLASQVVEVTTEGVERLDWSVCLNDRLIDSHLHF